MVLKKDSWLVRGVLIAAVAAFVAVPILFGINGRASSRNQSPSAATQPTADETTQLEGEIQGYTAVLSREPDNQTALSGIIYAKSRLGDLEGTVEPLERLVDLNPSEPRYAVLLAQTKQQLNDLEGAAQVYRSVLTQTPGSVPALEGFVALLLSQNRTEAAIGLLQDTLKTADQNNGISSGSIDELSVKLLLGQVYVEGGQLEQALSVYDEAIADAQASSPTQPDFRPTLAKGLVLKEQGKDSEAQALFDQAIALAPAQYKDGVRELVSQKTSPSGEDTVVEENVDAVEENVEAESAAPTP
ncbi:tetratricopeptide repeat domain protein [Synechococcus sp. PCC 7335]|uniref:tetratricopeptide repeat protein n=1 Tax=Synechococcus sp. (strain ATCC 29403 / PCC 7335) TaxID=91464 RepID=UPI00017ECB2B|nr:tetratricopeptide repeat protein [Synechococcus sp. PCC 7335]EDX87468.1 tetratricopeptide repeat domain protein [Synechococcus sp. PCC 7335]